MINLLQTIKQVNLEALATTFPLPILFDSRRRKIQRFLSLACLKIETLWFPIIKNWLADNFPLNHVLYIVIDRSSWGWINLLMISMIYDGRALPIYLELLPKLGSTNLPEQQTAIAQILPGFKEYKTIVLGDREFCSVTLANWLREQHVYFCLRLRKDEFVQKPEGIWAQLTDLGLAPGVSLFMQGVKVTKTKKMTG